MNKEELLISALKESNRTRKVVINRLLDDFIKKDTEIIKLKFRISLLKRFMHYITEV
jgi:hypothetical protein